VNDAVAVAEEQPQTDGLLLEQQLCFALSVASRSVIGAYRPVLEPLNLTHPQYLVMLALWEHSPRTVRELSETLAMEPATLSPMLKRLEASGLVSRDRMVGNERALAVDLTLKGKELRAQAVSVPETMLTKLGLSREQAENLNLMMREVIAATQQT
jgi:DNA-binding MarR family transcriptional regulator